MKGFRCVGVCYWLLITVGHSGIDTAPEHCGHILHLRYCELLRDVAGHGGLLHHLGHLWALLPCDGLVCFWLRLHDQCEDLSEKSDLNYVLRLKRSVCGLCWSNVRLFKYFICKGQLYSYYNRRTLYYIWYLWVRIMNFELYMPGWAPPCYWLWSELRVTSEGWARPVAGPESLSCPESGPAQPCT